MNSHMFAKITAEDTAIATSGPRTQVSPIVRMDPLVIVELRFSTESFTTLRPLTDEVTNGLVSIAVTFDNSRILGLIVTTRPFARKQPTSMEIPHMSLAHRIILHGSTASLDSAHHWVRLFRQMKSFDMMVEVCLDFECLVTALELAFDSGLNDLVPDLNVITKTGSGLGPVLTAGSVAAQAFDPIMCLYMMI